LWSQYKKTYCVRHGKDDAGKMIDNLVNETKNPADLVNALFNISASGGARGSTERLYNRIQNAIGKSNPEVISAINAGLKAKLLAPKTSDRIASFKEVADRIEKMTQGPQSILLKKIMSPEEFRQIQRYGKVSRMLSTKGVVPSNATIMRTLTSYGLKGAAIAIGALHGPVSALVAPFVEHLAEKGVSNLLQKNAIKQATKGAPYVKNVAPPKAGRAGSKIPALYEESVDSREGRASGGRISMAADRLVREAMKNQRMIGNHTEQMLSMPDDAIVSALDVAKKTLGGAI